jgi:hypothetical protein
LTEGFILDSELETFLQSELMLALSNIRKHLISRSSSEGLSLRPSDVDKIVDYLASVEKRAAGFAEASNFPGNVKRAGLSEVLRLLERDRIA